MIVMKTNASLISDEELIASFCVRTHEFNAIIQRLREHDGVSSQHKIVIGPPGSGKTMLLRRVAAELRRDPDLSNRFVPLVFSEESYGITTADEFWLETEYLDPDWRLDAYTKILDVTPLDNGSISIVLDMLKEMLESHTAKVVECFAKITDAIDQRDIIYLDTDEAKSILKAGLDSEDESVRENAERAQETLLNAGRDSFLDL